MYILERSVIFAIETRGFDKRVQISSSMQAAYRFLSIKRICIAEYNYSFKKKLFGNRNKIRSCVKENPMKYCCILLKTISLRLNEWAHFWFFIPSSRLIWQRQVITGNEKQINMVMGSLNIFYSGRPLTINESMLLNITLLVC